MGVCCLRPVAQGTDIETSPKISNDFSNNKILTKIIF